MSFISELKRRNVFRVGVAYALIAWVVLQVVDFLTELIGAPDWVLQVFFIAAAIGLLAVVIFSWVFEMTPEGLKKEKEVDRSQSITPQTGQKLNTIIIVFLAVAVAFLLGRQFWFVDDTTLAEPSEGASAVEAERLEQLADTAPDKKSVAVLPFVAMSSGEDDEYFADGLTEEILNSLAQLPELLVTARTSSFAFKGETLPSIQEIAATLGVAHVVEGSVRRSGDRIRVTAQLIRASDGFHLWSENYDSTEQDTITVQEDIAEKIAVALDVVLDDSKRQAMQLAGLRNIEAFTKYQEARYWYEAAHGEMNTVEGLRKANELFEEVLEIAPTFSQAYLDHSDLYAHYMLHELAGFESDMDQVDIGTVMDRAIDDYDQAIRFARNDRERLSYEFDRAYLSGQWRGLPGRMEQVLNGVGCVNNNWISQPADIYGYAHEHVRFAREIRLCDPLVSIEWFVESRALFWAGELEQSLAVALQGSEVAPGGWLNSQMVYTLTALGRFEDANRIVVTRTQDPVMAAVSSMVIAGAKGDRDALDRAYQRYQEAEGSRMWTFLYYVWSGQDVLANDLIAELDEVAYNHFAFTVFTTWCACGAPFALEATPNFAEKIRVSGLTWPPPSPIDFPLMEKSSQP